MKTPAHLACLGLVAASVFAAPRAQAFERQWHLGGGFGVAGPSDGYDLGPALGVYGAYGISDVFDLRLELTGSRHDLGGDASMFYGARLGLAYKIDIIEWIPYAGVAAGGFAVVGPADTATRPSAGLFAGLDYVVSRHFGVGVLASGDLLFASTSVTYGAVLARAEYRFGW